MELRLLGPVSLTDASGVDLLGDRGQPKRLALLAYLAISAPSGFVRRDTLLALFWPDAVERDARRSLNQAIHHLRQMTGEDVIVSRGAELLGVDSKLLSCDAVRFDDAIKAGRREDALDLYRGPLLDGVFLSNVPEFDEWLTRERSARARSAGDAAWAMTEATTARTASLAWGARAYSYLPDEGGTRRLIALHDRWGDRAGAIHIYEDFAAHLAAEYSAEPAPETQALIAAVRARETPAPGQPQYAPPHGRSRRRPMTWAIAAFVAIASLGYAVRTRSASHQTSLTTRSAPALHDYLAGDSSYRAGRFAEAVRLLRRAVDEDTSFAIAYYRLATAANWTGDRELQLWADSQSVAHIARLAPIDSARVAAWMMVMRGSVDSAEVLYTHILAANPNDVDAQFHLADLQFHWGSGLGVPLVSTLPRWLHLAADAPTNGGVLIHAARVAAAARDQARFDSLAAAIGRLDVDPDRLAELHVLRAYAFGDHAARVASVREFKVLRQPVARDIFMIAAAVSPTLDDLNALVAVFLDGNNFSSREDGMMLLRAEIELARGHVRAATATIDSAALIHPAHAREIRAMIATLPFPIASLEERRSIAASLATPVHSHSRGETMRHYLLALLAVRAGDTATARVQAAALDTVRSFNGADSAYARRSARLIRAELLAARGVPGEALALLGAPQPPPERTLPVVWSYPYAHERFLRAQLLEATGKLDDALRWYRTFPDPRAYDLIFKIPALERRARIAKQLGRREESSAAYAELIALLASADPEWRGYVDRLRAEAAAR